MTFSIYHMVYRYIVMFILRSHHLTLLIHPHDTTRTQPTLSLLYSALHALDVSILQGSTQPTRYAPLHTLNVTHTDSY